MKTVLLKSLVGSRAHNLHTEDSDYDIRGVYVIPTSQILSLGYKYSGTSWIEGKVDDTSYEIGHFLSLCTKANPAVLEVLLSEDKLINTTVAKTMRSMLPMMYNPKDAFNAFAGYSTNQRKKLLDDHLGRRNKFAVAYIRTAACLVELFETGAFSLKVTSPILRSILLDAKSGTLSNGEVVDIAESYLKMAKDMLPDVKNYQDLDLVNDFLVSVRREYFDETKFRGKS